MNMKMILSAKDTKYLHTEVPLSDVGTDSWNIEIDEKTMYQTILGFGGAFTESAAVTYRKMSAENQKRIINAYFDKEKGLNYTLGRVAIASSDFSEEMYDYLDGEDETLESYDISREDRAVFPMLKDATEAKGSAIKLLASPWSPPAFMKDNKNRKKGGHLLFEYADVYAKYLIRYIKEARKRGFHIEWLSVQNETYAVQTWDSCIYTPEQERDFVKNHLGPALIAANMEDVKILIHDHNRDILLERTLPILSDPEAAKFIWGTAVHWYVCEDFAESSKLHEAHPDKHILFTEGCVEGGPAPGAWKNAERYARNIIGDLNNFVEGWIEWNLVLDELGGPNHVGNFCCAPILCDTKKDEVIFNPSYYAIGHFSKYIMPGAVRVGHSLSGGASASQDDSPALKVLSAKNPDGYIVAVILNESDNALPVRLAFSGNVAGVMLPPRSMVTFMG